LLFAAIISALGTSGCSRSEPPPVAKTNLKITYADPAKAQQADESTEPMVTTAEPSTQDTPKMGTFGSEIRAMTDGFGDRTETRTFWDHPLIQRLILRTSKDGQKMGFVYGLNGDVKLLPADALDKAITLSPDLLAKAAGITEGKRPNLPNAADPNLTIPPNAMAMPNYGQPSTGQPTQYAPPGQGPQPMTAYTERSITETDHQPARPQVARQSAPSGPTAEDLRRNVQLPIAKRTPKPE